LIQVGKPEERFRCSPNALQRLLLCHW
jgi:hypothetical protein